MKAKTNYIDQIQFEEILRAIPLLQIRKWHDSDVVFLFKVCYWCALRMKEGVGLSKEDFDLENREVYLGKTKGKKNQYAPIPEPFLPQVKQYLDSKKDGLLLENCNPQIVRVWIRRLGVLLDIPAWTTPQSETGEKTQTHIFRKSIGKDMIYGKHGKKAPLNVVQKQLRHSSLVMTSKYLQVGLGDVVDWWKKD